MNRGKITPAPQGAPSFGFPSIQLQAAAGQQDQTTPGALVGCIGAPRTALALTNYQPPPWYAAVGL